VIDDLLIIGLPFLIAFLVALAIPALGITQFRIAERVLPDLRITLLLVLIALGAAATVLLAPRMLNETLFKPTFVFASDFSDGNLASRMLSALLVGAAAVEIVRGWLASRRERLGERRILLWAVVLFFLATPVFQLIGSDHPEFRPRMLYVPLVLAAVCLTPLTRIDRVLLAAKLCALACMFGSLVAAAVAPDFALARPAPGVLPGIEFRLFGLAHHANSLGPLALVALLLELHQPLRRRPLHWASLAASAAVLVLAQSKTAWIAAVLMVLVVWLPWQVMPVSPLAPADGRAQGHFARASATLVASLLMAAALLVASAAALPSLTQFIERNDGLLTLSGRFHIWELSLEEWRANPLFGYGPGLWSPEYMRAQNMEHVGQAHNQFVQSLGDSGLVGLALLLVYLGALGWSGVRSFRETRGLVLALFVLIAVRCVTEASLRSDGLMTWSTFIQVLTVALACHGLRARRGAALPATAVAKGAPAAPGASATSTPADARAGTPPSRLDFNEAA